MERKLKTMANDVRRLYCEMIWTRDAYRAKCKEVLSKLLKNTDADHHKECNITCTFNGSPYMQDTLVAMFYDKNYDSCYFFFEDSDYPMPFDDMVDEDLILIIDSLS